MNVLLHFPVTETREVNNLEDVCRFYSELTSVFGLGWHPDDPFDTLYDAPGGKEEAARIIELIGKCFTISREAGMENPYDLALASTWKIRADLGLGTEFGEDPLAIYYQNIS